MHLSEVEAVLDALAAARVRHWVAGGWGVDALVSRQTRDHRDLDLLVEVDPDGGVDSCLSLLGELGYAVESDWLPVRVEVVAPGSGRVDLHPVVITSEGAVQEGPDGTTFDYPDACLVTGQLGGRTLPCLSAERQLAAHAAYPRRPVDEHDLALLVEMARP